MSERARIRASPEPDAHVGQRKVLARSSSSRRGVREVVETKGIRVLTNDRSEPEMARVYGGATTPLIANGRVSVASGPC